MDHFNSTEETDGLYSCYQLIGVDKTTESREYCELKNLQDQAAKFECIGEKLGLPERKGEYCYLDNFWEDLYVELYACLLGEAVPVEDGEDGLDYTGQGAYMIKTDSSTYCEKEFNYNLKQAKKNNPNYSYREWLEAKKVLLDEKYTC